jgi:hypothetical protein
LATSIWAEKEHARSPSHPFRVPCGRQFHGSREVDADHYTATIWAAARTCAGRCPRR